MASEDKLNVISETIFKMRGISLTSYLFNQGCMSVTKTSTDMKLVDNSVSSCPIISCQSVNSGIPRF